MAAISVFVFEGLVLPLSVGGGEESERAAHARWLARQLANSLAAALSANITAPSKSAYMSRRRIRLAL